MKLVNKLLYEKLQFDHNSNSSYQKHQNQNSKFDFFMYTYACPTFVLKLYNISCVLGSHVV